MATNVLVTIDDDHLTTIDEVAKKLKQAGLKVGQVFMPLGIISGSLEDEHRQALAKIPGVLSVENETPMSASGGASV